MKFENIIFCEHGNVKISLSMNKTWCTLYSKILLFSEVLKSDTTNESLNAWMEGLTFLATHFVNLAEEFKSEYLNTVVMNII